MTEWGNRVELEVIRVLYRQKPLREYRVTQRPSDSFVYYVRGGHLFDFGNSKVEAKAGQMLYIPYGSDYTNHTLTEGTEYYQIDFAMQRKGKTYALFEGAVVLPQKEAAAFLPVMREIYEQYSLADPSGYYFCVGSILKIVGMMTRERKNSELQTRGIERIQKTVSYLNEFYYLDTSVGELAEMSATCVSNLEKTFKACLGMTPLAYRSKLRMEHAKMLLSGGYSVAEAGKLVGIPDVYYFSRLFRKICGMPPSAYGNNNRSI